METKEKNKQRIEKLFAEKISPVIQPQVNVLVDILDTRKRLADEITVFQQKIEGGMVAVRELQVKLDAELLKGDDTRKRLRDVEFKKAELQANERHLEQLTAQDIEAAGVERAAVNALTEEIKRALSALRGEIEGNVEALLTEALGAMIAFEQGGLDICQQNGVDLGLEFEKDHPRLKYLNHLIDDLSAYCSPVGQSESLSMRRRLRREWLQE